MTDNLVSGAALAWRQHTILIITGAALWFVAAMLLRVLGPTGIYEGSARVWLYLLVIPGTWPFVALTARVAGLAVDQKAIALAIVTGTATLIDGITLAWLPWIYGDSVDLIAAAGAVILWGAGVALALGLALNKRV